MEQPAIRSKVYFKPSPNTDVNKLPKLRILKSIKILTGLGLKEAKELTEKILDVNNDYNLNNYVEIDIINEDQEQINILKTHGVSLSGIMEQREEQIDDLLKLFEIFFIRNENSYIIFDGSFKIENNIAIVNIIDGKFKVETPTEFKFREIKNTTLKINFSEIVIEEY